jgi:type IV pilus assembly protein PilB
MIALRIPANLATRREVLPFIEWQGKVHVACNDPRDTATFATIQRAFDVPVVPIRAEITSLRRAIHRVYSAVKPENANTAVLSRPVTPGSSTGAARGPSSSGSGSAGASGSTRPGAVPPPEPFDATETCDEILYSAVMRQASDIHFDPGAEYLRVRFRVDGQLEDIARLPSTAASSLTNRIKVLSGMDISEKRAPQDGGFKHEYGENRTIDIRAATLPTKWGERTTLRLLGLQTGSLTLQRLGMTAPQLVIFEKALSNPYGMILLTGPTGSGKSTTLYAAIRRLLELESLNIITVEDPVEYDIQGVAQVAVDSADKTSFAGALRSILRHDPDVVMIGEIRDAETAGIAVKASLTGHLVFSSLHTNTAAGSVTRLADMGVERYLVASTLRLAIAQRLVRRLCARCREANTLSTTDARVLNRLDATGRKTYDSRGCLYCGGRGFVGRVALFEFLALDETWSGIISDGAQEMTLITEMKKRGMPLLIDDALDKLESGLTTLDEVRSAVATW